MHAVELSNASEQSSSTMVSRVARRCRLVQVTRHGATSANWALGDRGELRAVSKKKEANCTPAIRSQYHDLRSTFIEPARGLQWVRVTHSVISGQSTRSIRAMLDL
ncbi:hypothetical protein OPV22_015053 [Ensete ventricosum]|uniref:Uncharacterized protein n=1 Tax=Ensete ventricosum TaxID=4639 RepID=A0AAV8RCS3_ENSVE|nr:hypothetical protein OPV22_015053 [Ensete ventricosum]